MATRLAATEEPKRITPEVRVAGGVGAGKAKSRRPGGLEVGTTERPFGAPRGETRSEEGPEKPPLQGTLSG